MRYCKKCGAKIDDLDAYCGNCGARIESDVQSCREEQRDNTYDTCKEKQNNAGSASGSLDEFQQVANDNIYALLCFILGIASFLIGFVAAIVSLVLYKKGMELCEKEGKPGASYCKIGKICSKVCIALTIVAIVVSILILLIPLFMGAAMI